MDAREASHAGLVRHHPRATVADHVCRHALHHLEGHGGIEEDGKVVVAVHVDEAGAHRHAPGVDLRASPLHHRPDRYDPVTADRHVDRHAGGARAIEHRATAHHEVVTHALAPIAGLEASANNPAICANAPSSRGISGPAGWKAISVVPRRSSSPIRARSAAASPVNVYALMTSPVITPRSVGFT